MNKKAFTLVELIVVITILAILGTIAFISLQGYSRDARDSVRTTDLTNISKQLQLMLVKAGQVYIPENKVDITASGTVILYQGEMGKDTLNKLRVNNGGLDPVDQTPYTYSVTKNLKQYELMGFLENGNQVGYNNQSPHSISPKGREVATIFPQANASTNLINRFPVVKGDSIGIILNPTTNEPINSTGVGVDIVNTNTTYKVYLDNSSSGSVSGTGVELVKFGSKIQNFKNCKGIINSYGYGINDGLYEINPTGKKSFDVYCDMTIDGGGYTRYLNIKKNYSYDDAKNCWLGKKINNSSIDCFNPNRFNMDILDKMMLKIGGVNYFYSPPNKLYAVNKTSSVGGYNCLGNVNYMTVMSADSKPVKLDLSNVSYIYLGVSYCVNGRGIGGMNIGLPYYLNYSYGGVFGPPPGNRERSVVKSEIYIR